ncbi:murein DD-endopeptidase MepM/ murein hydrolase activator NlpD [Paraburkholderia sp. WSM4175]|uniref:M23 family metallopeptidase n=1 Tax=Paraburkholderia sp. WSM4175 TaxID=2991072 RepID=UPI003D1953BC
MRLSYLCHACASAQAISTKVSHLVHSRFESVARAVLLCGVVAVLSVSAWVTVSEIVSRANKSSASQPTLALEMAAPATDKLVTETGNSQLSDAGPFVMSESYSGAYAGRIKGNLLDTLERASVPVEIREQIARIFASRLDLAAPAHKDDTYHVLYARDETTIQRKHLTAVELRSRGETYQAMWFIPPGQTGGDYYSFDGRRLAAEPFSMPLDYVRVSSRFGYRTHPVTGRHLMHTGVDFAAPKGTPVVAAASGTVQFVGIRSGYGKIVVLRHPRGYMTFYAHLSAFARDLRVGAPVTEGQALGAVGATGTATGAHLHFEVRKNNQPIDPISVTSRTGTMPLTTIQRIAFDSATGALREKLAALPVDIPTTRMASNAEGTPNRSGKPEGSSV